MMEAEQAMRILEQEVERAIKQLSVRKAPGID
jgi:hypothetical protein